jgi:uncharacterized protein GlcG (DUF336 family)
MVSTMVKKLVAIQSSIHLSTANQIIDTCLKLRTQNQLLPLAVAVLDSGGNLVAFKREDGCGILRHNIAIAKAWAVLGMGMSTRQIRDRLADRPTFQAALAVASDGKFIPTPGGVLIIDQQGVAIGSVGISGDASDKDEYCAIEAIRMAGLTPEPPSPVSNWDANQL